MRILHVIPDIGISNGVMSVILNYAKAMPADIQFDVLYFAEKEKTRQKDIEQLGGCVYKVDRPSPKDLLSKKMKGFFAEYNGRWEALHIHCPHFALFIAPDAKKSGIKKIFIHCHTTEYSLNGNSNRNRILSLYSKYFIKNKFACSNTAGKFWYGNKAFTVLNNAIDCDSFTYKDSVRNMVRERMGLQDAFVVCHIGQTDVVQKNHPFIFKVFAKIKEEKSNARLMLIGANKNEMASEICAELGIMNDVEFLGSRTDVSDLLCGADVFLFPSTSEGLPVSVVEAQASGLPVLMSEAVTKEVAATDLVKTKSLSDSVQSWADACTAISQCDRRDTSEELKAAGWNISDSSKKLLSYYLGEK